ncbi:RNA polymerase sigma factor [Reyranella sp. CPCC 100927]|uniref:RNA polymerase sigma factor n=1 Tax=Reyranella sp. CPCC 100927 TaxID=2599616 RepID=UPI0021051F67|nr:RNA polymerase sigma factor [Reyranella sp. CPCC 100927]
MSVSRVSFGLPTGGDMPAAANTDQPPALAVADQLPQHLPALRRYARMLTGDATAADDLLQDCAERALSRARLWRPSGNLRAWLFTIMHNLHANHRRRAASRPPEAPIDEVPEPAWPAPQFDTLAANQTLAAVGRLSPVQREVLLLVAVDGMAYSEVAAVLNIPVGTVMSRLSRARDQLRRVSDPSPT